jgi:hypothetical protein
MTNVAEVLTEIEKNNGVLSLVESATIKVEGMPDDIERCTPSIRQHKAEIISILTMRAKGRKWTPGNPFTCQCGERTGWATDGVGRCPACAFDAREPVGRDFPGSSGAMPIKWDFSTLSKPGEDVCFKVGYPWVKDHLPELLAAGWTRRELFGRGRYKWPFGDWGLSWAASWGESRSALSIGTRGEVKLNGWSCWPVSKLVVKDATEKGDI